MIGIDRVGRLSQVLAETLDWVRTTVLEFGLSACGKNLVDIAKGGLDSPNAGVRTAATKLLGAMHQTLGAALGDVLRPAVKPALMTAIEAEFGNNPGPAPGPTREARAGAGAPSKKALSVAVDGAGGKPAKRAPVADPADDLLPKTDISGQITAKLVKDLGSSVWKERQAAVEQVWLAGPLTDIRKIDTPEHTQACTEYMPFLADQKQTGSVFLFPSPEASPWVSVGARVASNA